MNKKGIEFVEKDGVIQGYKNGRLIGTVRLLAKPKKAVNADGIDTERGVGVIIQNGDKYLVAERMDTKMLGGPGGHIQEGETSEQAAIRETTEEFGIKPIGLKLVGKLQETRSTVFVATGYKGAIRTDKKEMQNAKWATYDELVARRAEVHPATIDGIELLRHKVGERNDAMRAGNGWVTMRGTHVLIGEGGKVQYGPTALQGRNYRQYQKNHVANTGVNQAGKVSYQSEKTCGQSMISQALHAQGFDGLPKVVSKADFDKACKASGFAAKRTYSGTTQDVVDAYQQQMMSGTFYVDCKAGGAQYGKGAYVSSDYTGNIKNSGIDAEMKHYQTLNASKGAKYNHTENITMDPSSKFVKHEDIRGEYIKSVVDQLGKGNKAITAALDKVKSAAAACDKQPGVLLSKGYHGSVSQKAALGNVYKQLKAEVQKKYGTKGLTAVNDAINRANKASKCAEFGASGDDVDFGVLAAECGYDAIIANGHGKSGSYTVILNRSKILVEGDPLV